MSAELEALQPAIEKLSAEDLLALLRRVTDQLQHKIVPNGHTTQPAPPAASSEIPEEVWKRLGVIRYTQEDIEAELAEIFTPEELAEMEKADISNLPSPPRPLWEMISEDREDIRLPEILPETLVRDDKKVN